MDAAEILIRKMNRQRKFEIVQLLAKRIGQAREASKLHPHGQVLSFHKTGRDVSETRIADSHLGYNLDDWSWGVTLIPVLAVIAVQLHKLREVHVQSECVCDSILIEWESIRSQLDLIRQTLLQIKYEAARAGHRALADEVGSNQFGFRIHCDENPLIANLLSVVAASNLALFLLDKGPDFVALNVAAAKVTQPGIKQPFATRADQFEQSQDRVAIESCKPLSGADRAALKQTLNRPCRRFLTGAHGSKGRLRLGLAEGHAAGIAAPALNSALTEVPKSLAGLVLASDAGHGASPLDFSAEKGHNELGSRSWQTPRFGLAPQPVQAGSGAVFVKDLRWWFDRDVYGVTGSDSDCDSDNHAGFILPESPVPAGLSYFTPKSFLLFRWFRQHLCQILAERIRDIAIDHRTQRQAISLGLRQECDLARLRHPYQCVVDHRGWILKLLQVKPQDVQSIFHVCCAQGLGPTSAEHGTYGFGESHSSKLPPFLRQNICHEGGAKVPDVLFKLHDADVEHVSVANLLRQLLAHGRYCVENPLVIHFIMSLYER